MIFKSLLSLFKKYKEKLEILFIALFFVILAFIPVLSLFHPGLPQTHDGPDHVARIMAFYQNLEEGVLVPRWGAFLNWGYGHPVLQFLYPEPSYIASTFHFVGFSFFDSVKFVFILGPMLSLLFMYIWFREFLSKESSLLGAILYTYAPYRFVDLYVRGDIGENLAFAFIPLTLFFIYRFYKRKNNLYLTFISLSLCFLILSHNAIALFTVPLILLYGLYLWRELKLNKVFIFYFLVAYAAGFLLSMFFWLPGLLEGKYTLRNVVTKDGYINHFLSLPRLIFSQWSFGGSGMFSVQIGSIHWIALLSSPFLIYRFFNRKKKYFVIILTLFLVSVLSIFIMLPMSDFLWRNIMVLQNLQFPWRFLGVLVLTTAVMGAFLMEEIPNKYKKIALFLSLVLILFLSRDSIRANGYFYNLKHLEGNVYKSTTDTGESSPIWSVRFMEKKPKAHLEVIDGSALIKELERKSTYHKYEVKAIKNTLFRENTLYFPGWEIKANGIPLKIEFQNMTYRGVMLFNLDKGSYVVEVKYKETKLRAISDAISLIVLFNILGFFLFKFIKKIRN